MWRRIYRQRRRLLLALPVFAILGALMVPIRSQLDAQLALFVLPLTTVGVVASVVAVRPRWGVALDLLAGTLILQELLFTASPLLHLKVLEAGWGPKGLLWLFFCYLLINFANGLGKIAWPGAVTFRARRKLRATPDEVWQAAQRAHDAAWRDADLVTMEPLGDGVTIELVPADPLRGTIAPGATERLLDSAPGSHRRILRRGLRGAGGQVDATLDERLRLRALSSGGTEVELRRTWQGLSIARVVRFWLEDQAGDALDDFAASLAGQRNWSTSEFRRRRRRVPPPAAEAALDAPS